MRSEHSASSKRCLQASVRRAVSGPIEISLKGCSKPITCLAIALLLASCNLKDDAFSSPPVRGLRAFKVTATAQSRIRRFPTILQPADVSRLSFEISGQLKAVTLEAGQKVRLGDVLAEIDPRSIETKVEQATAGVNQAEALLGNAEADFKRKDELLRRGFGTQAAYDQSNASLLSARAQADQARRQLDLAGHNLDRAKMLAPFEGTVAGIEVKSFAQVSAGQPIVTLFSDDRFEMSFLAPSSTYQSLRLRQPVDVKIPDHPELALIGEIKELGSKADQVSAFPVVVSLQNTYRGLNAGLPVEVAIEEPLATGGTGYLLPLSVLLPEGGKDVRGAAEIFLYDGSDSTVRKHGVRVGGIRENQLIVTEGVSPGDLVASAGVSYLSDGQKVKLLTLQE